MPKKNSIVVKSFEPQSRIHPLPHLALFLLLLLLQHNAAATMERIVVIGGGITGVTCSQEIAAQGGARVTLIAGGGFLKGAKNVVRLTRKLETFDIVETPADEVRGELVDVVEEGATSVDIEGHKVVLQGGGVVEYDKLCLCMGASPKRSSASDRVLTLRDTESTQELGRRLKDAKRIMIVGNGGIALELVHEIRSCEIIWAFRDAHIGNSFFDNDAASFLSPSLSERVTQNGIRGPGRSVKPSTAWGGKVGGSPAASGRSEGGGMLGSALGPQWLSSVQASAYNEDPRGIGEGGSLGQGNASITLEVECEVDEIREDTGGAWPVTVRLTNGREHGCDFVVQATGVEPNTGLIRGCRQIQLAPDGGIMVDGKMQTTCKDVYAAGDICTVTLPEGGGWGGGTEDRKWHQMRLWSQGKSQGAWVARCMLGKEEIQMMADPFELFAHATSFLGYKVVLLGRYNAQGMRLDDPAVKIYIRCLPGKEYVKVTLRDGRMQGAVLIGETDLEETFENLILNGLDLTCFGADILDPDIDLEDYFD